MYSGVTDMRRSTANEADEAAVIKCWLPSETSVNWILMRGNLAPDSIWDCRAMWGISASGEM